MNLYKFINSKKTIYLYLFIIAFIIAFTSSYNPFNFREMHVDSSVYMSMSDGITRGLLPYRDLVDNKGIILYLINVPGLLLGRFTGVWFTQLILFYISILFTYKTALLFGSKYKALLSTFLSFVFLLAFYIVSAGAEEYSLPFLSISFYIFTKFYYSDNKAINFIELIVLGICFSCAVIIRLNMFPLWAGFCFVILIESIIKKHFLQLLKYISGFLIGTIIITIPIIIFLKYNDILNLYIEQVIIGGTSKGFNGTNLKDIINNFYGKITLTYSFLPLIYGLYSIINKFPNQNCWFHIAYTLSYLLTILFMSFSYIGVHSNLIIIPFMVPAFIFFINILFSLFKKSKFKKTFLFFLIFFTLTNEGVGKNIWVIYKSIFIENLGNHLFYTGNMIDENTLPEDSIISLGYNAYIYPFTKRKSASKYIYQGSGLDYIPNAKEEFISDILINKPAMIVVYTGVDNIEQYNHDWHAEIYEMIHNEYYVFAKNKHFNLYKKNT